MPNLRSALTQKMKNSLKRAENINKLRAENKRTVPSLLGDEKETNPFLRCDMESIAKAVALEANDPVTVFAEVRLRKDNF